MAVPLGTTGHTGQRCPETGVWKVVGVPSTTAAIAKGNIFPPHNDGPATWQLIQYA